MGRSRGSKLANVPILRQRKAELCRPRTSSPAAYAYGPYQLEEIQRCIQNLHPFAIVANFLWKSSETYTLAYTLAHDNQNKSFAYR